MIVESEPNGFLMVRYKLYFNQQTPDPEDPWVLSYLEEHGLQPRRQLDEKHQGTSYKVLHFGQCYLKRHIHPLGELYQRGVEHSALHHHIQTLLDETDDVAVRERLAQLDAAAQQAVVTVLTTQLHEVARFDVSEKQELTVSIEAATVIQAFIAAPSST
jgi:hypothetical protein